MITQVMKPKHSCLFILNGLSSTRRHCVAGMKAGQCMHGQDLIVAVHGEIAKPLGGSQRHHIIRRVLPEGKNNFCVLRAAHNRMREHQPC